jgi:carbon starvation protein
MQQIVVNSTVDGVLAALFAVLVIIVLANAAVVCVRAVRSPTLVPGTESPFVQSNLVAPSGLIPTARERAELGLVAASAGSAPVSGPDGGRRVRSGPGCCDEPGSRRE